MEIWKDIPWTDGFYQVSNMGNVRSMNRTYIRSNGRPFTARGRMVPCHWHDGYVRVRLNVPNFPKWHTVHKLVMEAFVGPRPDGMLIAHGDGIEQNNRLSNLRYATNAENQEDRIQHGTANINFEGNALTEKQIVEMRECRAIGEDLKTLAARYGVTKSYVSMICIGKVSKHIGGPLVKAMPRGRKKSLTAEQEAEIIRRRGAGEKIVSLSLEFGVCHTLVSKIYRRSMI